VRARLVTPKADRLLVCAEALRRGLSVEEICAASHFDPWFVRQIAEIIAKEADIRANGLPKDAVGFRALKAQGFSDARLAKLTGSASAMCARAPQAWRAPAIQAHR
jgi:carbamoyl-phosphate synthase large subunit